MYNVAHRIGGRETIEEKKQAIRSMLSSRVASGGVREREREKELAGRGRRGRIVEGWLCEKESVLGPQLYSSSKLRSNFSPWKG